MDNLDENQERCHQPNRLAEDKKVEGNAWYVKKKYHQAIKLYTEAIKISATCASYYTNRAAAYMMLEKYVEALHDAKHAISLDDQLVKGHLREGKCQLALGFVDAAIIALQRVVNLEPTNEQALKQALEQIGVAETVQSHDAASLQAHDKGDFEKVVFHMDTAILYSPACTEFKIRRAEALFKLCRLSEGLEALNAVLDQNPNDADAHYVQGLCAYHLGNIEEALRHFQQAFNYSLGHSRARLAYQRCKEIQKKNDEGDAFANAGKFQEAYIVYTELLATNPHDANLYYKRALVVHLGAQPDKRAEAIKDYNNAIDLCYGKTNWDAFRRRAECYFSLEKYEEAVRDFEKILGDINRTEEDMQRLQIAKVELKKSNYYKTLGLQKNCSEDEFKAAYKELARLHHPDRHCNKTPEERKQEESKFQKVSEAYRFLSELKQMGCESGQDI